MSLSDMLRARFLCTIFLILMSVGKAEAAGHTECSDCHSRGKNLKNRKVNELCISCHPDNIKDHVLDVISRTAPKGLPLDSENRITCITCHDAHDKAGKPSMLRMDQSEICAPCHPNSKGP